VDEPLDGRVSHDEESGSDLWVRVSWRDLCLEGHPRWSSRSRKGRRGSKEEVNRPTIPPSISTG